MLNSENLHLNLDLIWNGRNLARLLKRAGCSKVISKSKKSHFWQNVSDRGCGRKSKIRGLGYEGEGVLENPIFVKHRAYSRRFYKRSQKRRLKKPINEIQDKDDLCSFCSFHWRFTRLMKMTLKKPGDDTNLRKKGHEPIIITFTKAQYQQLVHECQSKMSSQVVYGKKPLYSSDDEDRSEVSCNMINTEPDQQFPYPRADNFEVFVFCKACGMPEDSYEMFMCNGCGDAYHPSCCLPES